MSRRSKTHHVETRSVLIKGHRWDNQKVHYNADGDPMFVMFQGSRKHIIDNEDTSVITSEVGT